MNESFRMWESEKASTESLNFMKTADMHAKNLNSLFYRNRRFESSDYDSLNTEGEI